MTRNLASLILFAALLSAQPVLLKNRARWKA